MRQMIFFTESSSGADSQIALLSSVRPLKIQALAAIILLGHTKILHTLIGMGSAAFVAAVPNPGKATRIVNDNNNKSTKIKSLVQWSITVGRNFWERSHLRMVSNCWSKLVANCVEKSHREWSVTDWNG